MDLQTVTGHKTVRLITLGRKSAQPRSVRIWFAVENERSLFVQHTSPRPAHWYRNLVRTPAVEVDFGNGPLKAHAVPLRERSEIEDVLARIRQKYLAAWIFRLIGWNRHAVAARITLDAP